ncbi:MAG TPA: Crp/Fnr family transcriptional regulator [Xanthobacteraceae bacterium]|nr:Crp/Fnr family transcriptional regulator [Xanthobacteraceae bacterium]
METKERSVLDDARRLLAECSLFRGLAPDERNAVVARAHLRKFEPGDTIFMIDSAGDSMMAILDGSVRISVPSSEGKEVVLAILHAGEVFGEIALLDGKGRTADARAMSRCNIAMLDRRDVLAFFQRHPDAWPKLVEVLCERLRRTDEHLAEMALLEIPLRLAKALLRLLASDARTGGAAAQVGLTQRELGNMVGASRESVNKCLNEWQRRGIVRIDDNIITIVDPTLLRQLAEPDWS